MSLASILGSHSKNMSVKTRNRIDERYRIQASACGGCLRRVLTGGWIGAGANARRNVALRDRRIRQYARSEYSGFDPRSLCGESEHLRPAGFLRPQTTQRQMGVRSRQDHGRTGGILRGQPGRVEDDISPAQGRQVPGRHAGHGGRRQMVARPGRHGAGPRQGATAHGVDDVGRPVQGDRSPDHRGDAAEAGQACLAQPRHRLSDHHQLQGRQGNMRRRTIPGRRRG